MSYLKDIAEYIRSGESDTENLGLELEHFIVDHNGLQITFDEVSPLIDRVGKRIGAEILYMDGYPVGYATKDYSVTLEPSCQFEISISPYHDLAKIKEIYEDFYSLWEPIFAHKGYSFVTKGNLPLVELGIIDPDEIPLSPKKRYIYMDAHFRKSGKYGKYMMRASASTQISVDYKSEEDLVRKSRVVQKIAPIIAILLESKTEERSHLNGKSDKPHLLRVQEWDDLDPARTGFFPGTFDEDFSYDKIADAVYNTPLILLTDKGVTTDVGDKSAKDLVRDGYVPDDIADVDRKKKLVEHFMSMGFFHIRIKKYIEIRIADSVPIDKAIGYVALIKGLIYSQENLETLEKELTEIDSSEKIQNAIHEIEIHGEKAVIYNNKTAGEWASHLKELADAALPANEKEYLKHV